jgi:hypothetical protein
MTHGSLQLARQLCTEGSACGVRVLVAVAAGRSLFMLIFLLLMYDFMQIMMAECIAGHRTLVMGRDTQNVLFLILEPVVKLRGRMHPDNV